MFQYLFNVQRELGGSTALEVGYLGSHSYRLERMFDWNETTPGTHRIGAEPEAVSRIHESPGNRQRRRGQATTRWRSSSPAGSIRDCRCLAATRCPSRRTTAAASARSTATRCSRRTASASSASGACRSSTCAIGSCRRSSTSCRSATASRSCRTASAARFWAGGRSARSSRSRADFRERCTSGTDRSNTGGGQDRPNVTGQDPVLPGDQQTIARWFNTDAYVLNALGTWGNAGRNTFFGPGITNVDASIIRNFRMRQQDAAVPARGVQRVEQPDLERPEHDDDQPRSTARSTARESRCARCSSV